MQIYISRSNGFAQATLCQLNHNTAKPVSLEAKNKGKIIATKNVEKEILRTNITENKIGVPLQLKFKVCGANNVPLKNVKIGVSHADKDGILPNNFLQGTLGKNWLTGFQKTNQHGECIFKTIIPGWQNGHLTHIKTLVFLPNEDILENLLFLPSAVLNQVYATPLYTKGKNPITINGDVFLQGNIALYNSLSFHVNELSLESGYQAEYLFQL